MSLSFCLFWQRHRLCMIWVVFSLSLSEIAIYLPKRVKYRIIEQLLAGAKGNFGGEPFCLRPLNNDQPQGIVSTCFLNHEWHWGHTRDVIPLRKKIGISFHFASLVHPLSINLKFSSNYFFILSSWLHGFIVTLRRDESLKNLIVCVKKKNRF